MEKILYEILEQVKGHSKRFDAIDSRLDSIEGRLGNVETELDNVKERLSNVETELDNVKGRLGSVETELDNVKGRLDNVETELGNVKGRLGNVEEGLHRLEETVNNNATEFRSHFKQIETKLDQHEEKFRAILNELIGVKIDIKYLSGKCGVHDTEINQLKKRILV